MITIWFRFARLPHRSRGTSRLTGLWTYAQVFYSEYAHCIVICQDRWCVPVVDICIAKEIKDFLKCAEELQTYLHWCQIHARTNSWCKLQSPRARLLIIKPTAGNKSANNTWVSISPRDLFAHFCCIGGSKIFFFSTLLVVMPFPPRWHNCVAKSHFMDLWMSPGIRPPSSVAHCTAFWTNQTERGFKKCHVAPLSKLPLACSCHLLATQILLRAKIVICQPLVICMGNVWQAKE